MRQADGPKLFLIARLAVLLPRAFVCLLTVCTFLEDWKLLNLAQKLFVTP